MRGSVQLMSQWFLQLRLYLTHLRYPINTLRFYQNFKITNFLNSITMQLEKHTYNWNLNTILQFLLGQRHESYWTQTTECKNLWINSLICKVSKLHLMLNDNRFHLISSSNMISKQQLISNLIHESTLWSDDMRILWSYF